MNKIAIITAAGTGKRMKTLTPKQFLPVKNKPLLYYTINLFFKRKEDIKIILVLPENHISTWNSLCLKYEIHIPAIVIPGGPTRFHSVKSGLKACEYENPKSIVAIHDGVRPFVSPDVISEGFSIASRKGSAVPVISVSQSIRKISGKHNTMVPRDEYKLVQTPQFFRLDMISEAYKIHYSEKFTDDASVFENTNNQITVFEGNKENIKITDSFDMIIAEKIIEEYY